NELKAHHTTLERLVAERTRDLMTTNLALQREIAEREAIAHQLERRIEFEQIIATISTQFIMLPPDKLGLGIDKALDTINSFVGAVRSYVCLFGENTVIETVYERCVDEPEVTKLIGLPKQAFIWWMGKCGKGVHVSSPKNSSADFGFDISQD